MSKIESPIPGALSLAIFFRVEFTGYSETPTRKETMHFNFPSDPIVIVVDNGRYECFSQHSTPTLWDLALMNQLQSMGGVAEGTEDGIYHFSVEHLLGDKVVAHMVKID